MNVPDLLAGVPIDSEMDRYFQKRARGRLRIREIDPLSGQLARVQQIPAPQLEEFIAATFRDADHAAERRKQEIEQIQSLWLSGDMEEAEAVVSRRLLNSSDFEKHVLQEVQIHLATAISQWMQRGERCFAVIDLGLDGGRRWRVAPPPASRLPGPAGGRTQMNPGGALTSPPAGS
jgi:hypothetical protein